MSPSLLLCANLDKITFIDTINMYRYSMHSKWFLELTSATRIPDSKSSVTPLFYCASVKIQNWYFLFSHAFMLTRNMILTLAYNLVGASHDYCLWKSCSNSNKAWGLYFQHCFIFLFMGYWISYNQWSENDADSIFCHNQGKHKGIVVCWFLGLGSLVSWNSMLTIGDYYYCLFPESCS